MLGDFWDDIRLNNLYLEGGVSFANAKKSEFMMHRILDMFTQAGDIVLDYHLGSGTTAAVAHKMQRQYIGIEQLYYGNDDSTVRLKNVITGFDDRGISKAVDWQGGGSFVYAHLKNDVNVFINEVEKADSKQEIQNLLKTILTSNFLSHRVDPNKFKQEEFAKFDLREQKRLLIDLVNKNKLYVNYHDMDDKAYKIDGTTKKLNHWLQSRD